MYLDVLAQYIASILLRNPKAPPMLDAIDMEVVKEMIEILKLLESVTKDVCGEKYLTASKIIPLVNCLTNKINILKPETTQGVHMQQLILTGIKKRFGAIEHVKLPHQQLY